MLAILSHGLPNVHEPCAYEPCSPEEFSCAPSAPEGHDAPGEQRTATRVDEERAALPAELPARAPASWDDAEERATEEDTPEPSKPEGVFESAEVCENTPCVGSPGHEGVGASVRELGLAAPRRRRRRCATQGHGRQWRGEWPWDGPQHRYPGRVLAWKPKGNA